MKTTTQKRIFELSKIQLIEEANNFPNGELWNDCEDKKTFLRLYDQEQEPKKMIDASGLQIGIILENGEEIYYTGMNFWNTYK